ncbi:MAG: methylmalonyl Co-A mutase-associated GTPase MeaB, partial [Muribaculaceae bacterium]|nr:methylmalonyl Co-A mutase-associated GTPase MeaB [Muribaculaceae bacterium]
YSGYYELGIAEVWDMIDRYFEFVKSNGYFERRRNQQARYWMMETIDEQLRNNFYRNPEVNELLMEREARVLSNRQSSFTAAKDVLDFYFRKFEK